MLQVLLVLVTISAVYCQNCPQFAAFPNDNKILKVIINVIRRLPLTYTIISILSYSKEHSTSYTLPKVTLSSAPRSPGQEQGMISFVLRNHLGAAGKYITPSHLIQMKSILQSPL